MEYLLVHFREDRQVVVNGHYQGFTNQVIELEAGRHRISLASPYDFDPYEWVVRLANTTVLSPHEIQFS